MVDGSGTPGGLGETRVARRVAGRGVPQDVGGVADRTAVAVLDPGDTHVVDRGVVSAPVPAGVRVRAVQRTVLAHAGEQLQCEGLTEVEVAAQQTVGRQRARLSRQHGVQEVVTEVILLGVVVRLVRAVAGLLQHTDGLGAVAVVGRTRVVAVLGHVLLELLLLVGGHLGEAGLVVDLLRLVLGHALVLLVAGRRLLLVVVLARRENGRTHHQHEAECERFHPSIGHDMVLSSKMHHRSDHLTIRCDRWEIPKSLIYYITK